MHDSGFRINGGIGFSISEPSIIVIAEASQQLSIFDKRTISMSSDASERLIDTLRHAAKIGELEKAVSFTITGEVSPNSGFGSGTSIRLACLEALYLVNGIKISDDKLVAISRRGGTSGIGINTYFQGGFVADLGRKNIKKHEPSFQVESNATSTPMLLKLIKTPAWDIGIFFPSDIPSISEEEEKQFFKDIYP